MRLKFQYQSSVLLAFGLALSACMVNSPTQQAAVSGAGALDVVAIGDMPYRPQDIEPFEALLETINNRPPDVTIHVGDIKGGGTPCTDDIFWSQRDYFNGVTGALVFTPGDNEWTDCHRSHAGGYDPRERLAFLREVFYVGARSLGQQPRVLEQQSALDPAYMAYVENARWLQTGVRFVTAHVVGSNNGLNRDDPEAVVEYEARNAASISWIRESFALARAEGAYAVVLAIHADPFQLYGIGGGFRETLSAIADGAGVFDGPVLVIHGDGHEYTLDTPFYAADGDLMENVIRLEVPGAADIQAVRIRIDPDAAQVFAFEVFGPS